MFLSIAFAVISGVLSILFFTHGHSLVCRDDIKYVNTEVACDKKPVLKKTGYAELQAKLESYMDKEIQEGNVSEVAFYFRDLENGPIFGVNELADFAPASLLKLPLALMYLQESEVNPGIMKEMLSYAKPTVFVKEFGNTNEIKPDVYYSVETLLERMIVDSDNEAAQLLYDHLMNTRGLHFVKEVYLSLGILSPNDPYDKVISVRRYASIFRGLYNASLLNVENSEKLLSWLSKSTFVEGLAFNMPKNIEVANKYGERLSPNGERQLHDCGIIYYPDNPYLLCVMTIGKDYEALKQIIGGISEAVYREVDSRKL